ncbi:MAG TPA: Gfo/Idh/MocA family oxidoreductase, partial [Anaerolineae bacterium]|nr:Gfo/Idh/MocA family oxidoreductase [Anaerolineae bacterium]
MCAQVQVGVIGCGNISPIYLKNGKRLEVLDIVACADLVMERARARADEFGVPRACTVEELLADAQIQIVLNLTTPQAHAEVGLAALQAGKSVHNEKPLAVERQGGKAMLELAAKKGLRVGGAPDTFLGAGIQTCRKLIDDGWIGEPVAAT